MTSKTIEDTHVDLINKLLNRSGLECIRSSHASVESETSEAVSEEQDLLEEEAATSHEEVKEEEKKLPPEEQDLDETPEIFPSPSLRRILPDKIRKIEEQNRICVLPEEFKTNIDPAAIPKIAQTAQQKYIDILAEMLGCKCYKSSLAEFWFLDTLANLLRRAQQDELDRPTQAVLILWFCEWMKEMQQFDAADRQRMLRRFKDNMLAAAKFIAEEDHLPTPTEAGVHYKGPEEVNESTQSTRSTAPTEPKHVVRFPETAYECSLRDLTKIIHYIFDLFSTDFQYNLVRSVFTFSPDYVLIDAPYQLKNPKQMYAPLKVKVKKEKISKTKGLSSAKDKKKKEPDTAEYLALMEFKEKDERLQDEEEERDRQDYNLRSHILPLNFAATDDLFDKYWPPPTPEPEPESEPEIVKGKGKGKGKK